MTLLFPIFQVFIPLNEDGLLDIVELFRFEETLSVQRIVPSFWFEGKPRSFF